MTVVGACQERVINLLYDKTFPRKAGDSKVPGLLLVSIYIYMRQQGTWPVAHVDIHRNHVEMMLPSFDRERWRVYHPWKWTILEKMR